MSGATNSPVPASVDRRIAAFILDAILLAVTLGVGWVVWSILLLKHSTSPGKKILGLKVVHASSWAPATVRQMLLRELVGKLVVSPVTAGLSDLASVIMILVTKKRQAVWDLLADTTVVRASSVRSTAGASGQTAPKPHMRPDGDRILVVDDLTVEFKLGKDKIVKAVSGVSFDLVRGETLAIVGESGCGKSTLGKAVLQLPKPTSGSVQFLGKDLTNLKGDQLRDMRPAMQMIFQDPISSLDPRQPVSEVLAEPLRVWNKGNEVEINEKIDELLTAVNLDPAVVRDRRSYEFSGGQCQRISIARALALDPTMIICDEPVSALDVSVQAQILNLLQDMKDRYGLTLVFISHDLAVVKTISTRVMVMYLGKVCEIATPDELYNNTKHHYTRALVDSVPIPDPTRKPTGANIQGEPPSPMNPPSGCRFRTRCMQASEKCAAEEPQLREIAPGHFVACHHPA